MPLSSSKLSHITPAKALCLGTIAVSCVIIAVRIFRRGSQ